MWYVYIARAHMHIDVQALDTLEMASGVNSSISMYGAILLMTESLMLSLSYSIRLFRNLGGSFISFVPGSQ